MDTKDLSLKKLLAQQEILTVEISKTRRAKKLAVIEKAIELKLKPEKERAKDIVAKTGKSSGNFKIENDMAAWSVATANVRAHQRQTVKFTFV